MSLSPINSVSTNLDASRSKPSDQSKLEEALAENDLSAEGRKMSTDAGTLQAHMDIQVGAGSKPQVLTTKAVLEALNEALEPDFGPNAIQRAYEEQVDVSPEATAERIVSLSTGFFTAYQEQHAEDDLETQLTNFIDLLSGGVDQGFGEAREILDGLGVLKGDIEKNIDRTYDLVFEGYDAFKQKMLDASIVNETKEGVLLEISAQSKQANNEVAEDQKQGGVPDDQQA